MTVQGTANGKSIELDEPLPFPDGKRLTVNVEPELDVDELPLGSPARILKAMREPPHITKEDTDELLRLIDEDKRPPNDRGCFDDLIAGDE